MGWVRKSYLGPAEIVSISSRDFIRNNNPDTFCHVASTGYFYVLFLWAIAISDFRPLETYKNLGIVCKITNGREVYYLHFSFN